MRWAITRVQNGFEHDPMKSTDPASLQNLNDIVLPAAVSWWPLAKGWYIVAALLLILLAWFGYRSLRRWMQNRYRRAALRELQSLENGMQNEASRDSCLRQIPSLLKRTALSIYPREQVASLAGKDWHRFLNSKLSKPSFAESVAINLDTVSYSAGDLRHVDEQAAADLLNASRYWLKYHQATTGTSGSGKS
jgi:hypothetical protein